MLGAGLAVWRRGNEKFLLIRPSAVKSVLGLLLIVVAISMPCFVSMPNSWRLLPAVGACLLIAAGSDNAVNRLVLGNPTMALIGRISYPLYLWHWPSLSFLRISRGDNISIRLLLFTIFCSLVLAWLLG